MWLGVGRVANPSNRLKLVGRLVAAAVIVVSALALLTFRGGGKSQAYKEGWDYVVKSVKSGTTVGQGSAPFVDCQGAAAAKWPGTYSYGFQSNANYQKFTDWNQGCSDALTWIDSSGLNGLQIKYF